MTHAVPPNHPTLPPRRIGVDDQIMGARLQVQFRRVGDDFRVGHGGAPEIRHSGHDGRIRKPSVNLCQPIFDLVGDKLMQKIDRTQTFGADAVARQGIAVGQAWDRGGTIRYHGGAT